MTVQEGYGVGQPVVVVDDELQVPHGLVALVLEGSVLRPHRFLWVVHLVNHVGYVAEVGVQPRGVLHINGILMPVVARGSKLAGKAEHDTGLLSMQPV